MLKMLKQDVSVYCIINIALCLSAFIQEFSCMFVTVDNKCLCTICNSYCFYFQPSLQQNYILLYTGFNAVLKEAPLLHVTY